MSVNIKDAVRSALEFVREMYDAEDLRELALEEVERSDDGTRWLVIVGMGGQVRASTMSVVTGEGTPRRYKLLEIDLTTGDVVAMRDHDP